MGESIFYIDNSVFICAHGGQRERDRENSQVCQEFLKAVFDRRFTAVTSAWTLLGLERRNEAIGGQERAFQIMDHLRSHLSEIFPVTDEDMSSAIELMSQFGGLAFEDAMHVSIMKSKGLDTIVTFDDHFRIVPGLNVLKPKQVIT